MTYTSKSNVLIVYIVVFHLLYMDFPLISPCYFVTVCFNYSVELNLEIIYTIHYTRYNLQAFPHTYYPVVILFGIKSIISFIYTFLHYGLQTYILFHCCYLNKILHYFLFHMYAIFNKQLKDM